MDPGDVPSTEPLSIVVSSGAGGAPTRLAAFDVALEAAGVAQCNLIKLTSIIPAGSRVISQPAGGRSDSRFGWGDRLYVVIADCRVAEPYRPAWAGLGWWQDDDGRGVFVEHVGASEQEVRRDIAASLDSLLDSRRSSLTLTETPVYHEEVIGITCEGQPVCAVVVASFASSSWFEPAP